MIKKVSGKCCTRNRPLRAVSCHKLVVSGEKRQMARAPQGRRRTGFQKSQSGKVGYRFSTAAPARWCSPTQQLSTFLTPLSPPLFCEQWSYRR